MGLSDTDFKQLRDKAVALDARRQRQIDNQIDSLNRLLKGGTYDSEMAALHQQLADAQYERDVLNEAVAKIRKAVQSPDMKHDVQVHLGEIEDRMAARGSDAV